VSTTLVASFDGGAITSDAGAPVLGATDRAIGLVDWFAFKYTRHYSPRRLNPPRGERCGLRANSAKRQRQCQYVSPKARRQRPYICCTHIILLRMEIVRISALLSRSGALVAVLAVTGCAGAPVIDDKYTDVSFAPQEYRAESDLPVLVQGDPFSIPQTTFDQDVADAMQGTTFGTDTQFVPAPNGSDEAYRVVMAFNSGGIADDLCKAAPVSSSGPAPQGQAPTARVELSAALCRGERAISYADGSVATAGGPKGSDFRWGVSQFSIALFPGSTPQGHGRG
jgi:hypothetical protein